MHVRPALARRATGGRARKSQGGGRPWPASLLAQSPLFVLLPFLLPASELDAVVVETARAAATKRCGRAWSCCRPASSSQTLVAGRGRQTLPQRDCFARVRVRGAADGLSQRRVQVKLRVGEDADLGEVETFEFDLLRDAVADEEADELE